MNKQQLYTNKLRELTNKPIPLDGAVDFAVNNYAPIEFKYSEGRFRPNGNGGYAVTNRIYGGLGLYFDEDYSNEGRKEFGTHQMYCERDRFITIGYSVRYSDIGKVVALFKEPALWLKNLSNIYAEKNNVNLTWLSTERGTLYSNGSEFFITKEHDGYWLWNTLAQIRLGLFSTETSAQDYAEHLRTR